MGKSTLQKERVVISQRAAGLGDCIYSLMSAWFYAKQTGRTLVVDWRRSLYLSDPRRNAFPALFEPVNAIDGVPVICDDSIGSLQLTQPTYSPVSIRGRWPALCVALSARLPFVWRLPFVARALHAAEADEAALVKSGRDVPQPTVALRSCLSVMLPKVESRAFLAHLRPRREIQEQIDSYAAEHLAHTKVVAVHVRHGNGGDIMGHTRHWIDEAQALAEIQRAVEAAQASLGAESVVFLSTDSARVEEHFRRALPKLVTRKKYFRPVDAGELHSLDQGDKDRRLKSAMDAVVEMFLLSQGDALVCYPPESYFSLYARLTQKRSSARTSLNTPAYELSK